MKVVKDDLLELLVDFLLLSENNIPLPLDSTSVQL
jgi:hypothetical protein